MHATAKLRRAQVMHALHAASQSPAAACSPMLPCHACAHAHGRTIGLELCMVLLVQVPVALEAIHAAVIAQMHADLEPEAHRALQAGLAVGVNAAHGTATGQGAAIPARAQLVNALWRSLVRHVFQRELRIIAFDHQVGL